jgi:protoheme IX farnesyltransferase
MADSMLQHASSLTEGIAQQFWRLMKPRVVSLIVFTAVIGMLLAVPGLPPVGPALAATLGIALVAGAAAAFNCLVEQKIDAAMARTRARPTVMGTISPLQILLFSGAVGGLGLAILWHAVNPLTMWLTMATFVGYAVIYTVILKPATPQNIVIGGASGAMPPVLGWAAMTGEVPYQPLLLFLIIFAWTPPHFWALALYRRHEYARAGVPMLPVTHGEAFTRLHLLLYTLILVATTLLPFATGMSGYFYLGSALVLDAVFVGFAVAIWRKYSDGLARRTFAYSIFYLAMLFGALMIDHYLPLVTG